MGQPPIQVSFCDQILSFLQEKPLKSLVYLEQHCDTGRKTVTLITYERVVQELNDTMTSLGTSTNIEHNLLLPSQISNLRKHGSYTPAFLPAVSQMTWRDRNSTLSVDFLDMSLLLILRAVSTSRDQGCVPFYTDAYKEKSNVSFAPTMTGSLAQGLNCSSLSSRNKVGPNSWFSITKRVPHKKKCATKFLVSSRFIPHVSTDSESTRMKSKRILWYPTPQQKKLLAKTFGLGRWFYNRTVDVIKKTGKSGFTTLKSIVSGKVATPEITQCTHVDNSNRRCKGKCELPNTLCSRHIPKPYQCAHEEDEDGKLCLIASETPFCVKHTKRNKCQAVLKTGRGGICGKPCYTHFCSHHTEKRDSQYDSVLPEWWSSDDLYVPRLITGAIQDASKAVTSARANLIAGNISSFSLKNRTKKDRFQSLYLEKSCFGKGNTFLPSFLGTTKAESYKVGNRRIPFSELEINCDGRLIHDTKLDRWYFVLNYPESVSFAENQGANEPDLRDSVISMDSGVRTFQTGYSPNGHILEIGQGATTMVRKYLFAQDILRSKIEKTTNKRKKKIFWKSFYRLADRVSNMVSELHWKTIRYLTDNYGTIIISDFRVAQMLKDLPRQAKWTKRMMCVFRHYDFKQRLIQKCRAFKRCLVFQNEAYTSKTCSACSWIKRDLGASKVFQCSSCGLKMDRDVNAARNIFFRAWTEYALPLTCALAPSTSGD